MISVASILIISQLSAEISAHCETEWPTDFEMQAYCVDKQKEGASQIADFMSRYEKADAESSAASTANLIAGQCLVQWEGDYEMIAYCIEKQEKAAQRLGKLPRVSRSRSNSDSSNYEFKKNPNSQIHNPPPERLVREGKEMLRRLGYFNGPVDGDFRGDTVAAILDYEAAHNLEITGRLDGKLVEHMRSTLDRR